jgi:hypothetical protein
LYNNFINEEKKWLQKFNTKNWTVKDWEILQFKKI